ncbi:hypothetical protein I5M32_06140 [Pedobacter sp. SD-b]|uniref:Uncharacterized protein n=1 Tax=Pedobacter segetis TaxID=2793069 RepID=A0ABS1BI73_9SPHI|nr:hypothetical protein [Pedobacter segetis]MBK0382538.1 hypothetical protein [Pedobacter segetis]
MKKTFDISIHKMGDVKSQIANVSQQENSDDFDIILPDKTQKIAVKFSKNGELVQTEGTPLDSNTLHSISEGIKKSI